MLPSGPGATTPTANRTRTPLPAPLPALRGSQSAPSDHAHTPETSGGHQSTAGRSTIAALCCLVALLFILPTCGMNRTVKLGLSAPFEGRHRDLGYEVLYAVRLAVRERNDAGGVSGRYPVELVALNDFDEPREAVVQARKMATDPDVLAVLGGWSPETAAAAGTEYDHRGLAFVAPPADWSGAGYPSPAPGATHTDEPAFVEAYQALSGGVPPGAAAAWAYAKANRILDAFDVAAGSRPPTRPAVLSLLTRP